MIGARQQWGAAGAYRAIEGIGAKPEDFMKMALDATRNLLLRAEAAIVAQERVEKASGRDEEAYRGTLAWCARAGFGLCRGRQSERPQGG